MSSCSIDKKDCGTSKKDCGTSSCPTGSCWSTMLKGAIVGGIIIYIVNSISWAVLPWHAQTFNGFKDQAKVTKALVDNAPVDGLYVIPFTEMKTAISSKPAADAPADKKEEKKVDKKAAAAAGEAAKAEAVPAGPFAFVNVMKSVPADYHKDAMLKYTLMGALLAGILTCILKSMSCCACPVKTSFKVALIAALVSEGTHMIWYNYPSFASLLNALDIIVGLTLAGGFIARFVLKMPFCGKSCCDKSAACGTEKKTGCCG